MISSSRRNFLSGTAALAATLREHLLASHTVTEGVRKHYSGQIIVGRDLLEI